LALTAAVILAQGARVNAEVAELKAGSWSGGAGLGFLNNTPDKGFDFALKGHADYFVSNSFPSGPWRSSQELAVTSCLACRFKANIGGTFQGTRIGRGW
jgi:hypothetical protein